MSEPTLLARVVDRLHKLHPSDDKTAVRQLLTYAGMEPGSIELPGASKLNWFAAAEAAKNQNKLLALVSAAVQEHKTDKELLELERELQVSPDIRRGVRKAITDLRQHRIDLRRRGHLSDDKIESLDDTLTTMDELIWTPAEMVTPSRKYVPSGIGDRLRNCFSALQLYAELLQASKAPALGHPPGSVPVRQSLQDVSADRFTLIQAKEQLEVAVSDLLQLYSPDSF